MEKPSILLVEDDGKIREEYSKSLSCAGFDVYTLESAQDLEEFLGRKRVNAILCDTENNFGTDGDVACAKALGSGVLEEEVLLIGMSEDSDNQTYWRGLAHFGGFYDKDYIDNSVYEKGIGRKVMAHYTNFRNQPNSTWRRRMPKIENHKT